MKRYRITPCLYGYQEKQWSLSIKSGWRWTYEGTFKTQEEAVEIAKHLLGPVVEGEV